MSKERKARKTYLEFVSSTQYQRKQVAKQRARQRRQIRSLSNG